MPSFSEVTSIDLAIFWVVCPVESLSKQTHLRIYSAPLAVTPETATKFAAGFSTQAQCDRSSPAF